MNLRDTFEEVLERLPEMLKTSQWKSTFVTYEYPHVERLWLQYGECRVSCHRILKIPEGEGAFFHQHPWAAIFKVFSGDYTMLVGENRDPRLKGGPSGMMLKLSPGSEYTMLFPSDGHMICPRTEDILSVMVTGKPFVTPIPKKYRPPTAQPELSREQAEKLRNDFLLIV